MIRDDLRMVAMGDDCEVRQFPLALTLDGHEPRLGGTRPPRGGHGSVRPARHPRESCERVKICPADDCLWAFYDESRNGSRQWCSMAVCGNRAKARAHRARQA